MTSYRVKMILPIVGMLILFACAAAAVVRLEAKLGRRVPRRGRPGASLL